MSRTLCTNLDFTPFVARGCVEIPLFSTYSASMK